MSNNIYAKNQQGVYHIDPVKQKSHDYNLRALIWLRNNTVIKCPHCGIISASCPNLDTHTQVCRDRKCHQPFQVDPLRTPFLDKETHKPIYQIPDDLPPL